MGWATAGNVITTNLDAGTDSPAAARPDLKAALDELTNVINGRGTSNGVASLDSNTKIPVAQIPDELNSSSSTNLTLDPATGKVALEEILNLSPQTVAQLNARTDKANGDVAFCSDGGGDSAGVGCIAVYDGNDWRAIQLGAVL
jgi:hypothetical protein|tara:strand:- start:40 stop:471 length:432 start_codon:yes stop_codon:yes gene_type:complete